MFGPDGFNVVGSSFQMFGPDGFMLLGVHSKLELVVSL